MVCQYCNKRLGLIQRLKGQTFCSPEHQELHFGLSFERLRESVTESTAIKVKPLWPPSKAKPPETEPDASQAKGEQPQLAAEQPLPVAEQSQTELEQARANTLRIQAIADQLQAEMEQPKAQ